MQVNEIYHASTLRMAAESVMGNSHDPTDRMYDGNDFIEEKSKPTSKNRVLSNLKNVYR